MPLSACSAPRRPVHLRTIECQGFERDDGGFDVEGHLTDTKTHAVSNPWRGETAPGSAVHDMWLRITVDSQCTLVAIEAASDRHPFENCPTVVPNFQDLLGVRITGGFQRRVRELLGNTRGCTHLVDLIGMLATVALQTMAGLRLANLDSTLVPKNPAFIDSCRGWAADGPVVRAIYPGFYKGVPKG
jgi:Protein of unknown function (DUF2889)